MTLRERLRPGAAPIATLGIVYVSLYVLTVVGVGLLTGGDATALAANARGTTMLYLTLVGLFGAAVAFLTGQRFPIGWRLVAVGLFGLLVAVRYVLPVMGGILSTVSVFANVFLPYLVVAALLIRLVVVRVGPKMVRSLPKHRAVAASLLLVGVLLAGTIGGSFFAVATAEPAVPPSDWSPERQLEYLERTDQQDRETGAFIDGQRDYERIERVLSLVERDAIETPEGMKRAAVVLHHGSCPAHLELAHRLASTANESDTVDATFWVRATYDRWQLSLGNEQRYGTQLTPVRENEPCRPPIPSGVDPANPLTMLQH